jgi:hypothetical protein
VKWVLPTLLRVRMGDALTLWLPLFLLWPLVLALFSLLLLVAVLAPGPKGRALACWATAWQLLCATRGTHVDVRAPNARVLVSVH